MASVDSQQTWVPYEPTKDCSQGFCSIYCPQWCYIIFPPPPPFDFSDDSSSGRSSLSPLVIAIIGILASAFLLVSYYTIISKYCGTFDSLRRRMARGADDGHHDAAATGHLRQHDNWSATVSDGLEEAVIKSITVCKYKKGDGFVDGTDCSVCLNEFREDESLRLLPKCSHAFHVQCIDTWLKSHSNCPLCRSNIVSPCMIPPPPQLPQLPTPPPEQESATTQQANEIVIPMEDSERGGAEEGSMRSKDPRRGHGGLEEGDGIIEMGEDGLQPVRRSVSMDTGYRDRVSIADVLEMGIEDDDGNDDDDHGAVSSAGSSTRTSGGDNGKGGGRSRGLHSVMSPVPMKRSFSSGRFNFPKQGKGSNAILPT